MDVHSDALAIGIRAERDVLARRGDLDRDPEDGGGYLPHGLGLRAAADQGMPAAQFEYAVMLPATNRMVA